MTAKQNNIPFSKFQLLSGLISKSTFMIVTALLLVVLTAQIGLGQTGSGLLSILAIPSTPSQEHNSDSAVSSPTETGEQAIFLRAGSGRTVTFKTQNGRQINALAPETKEVPHLVLYRNEGLTAAEERTITLNVHGIPVPPSGARVTIKIETQHADPDLGKGSMNRIAVWQSSQWIANTSSVTRTASTLAFKHSFERTVMVQSDLVPTPTGYFRYEVIVTNREHPVTAPLHTFAQDFAFLMESQAVVPLPGLREASTGAAPRELIVHYADMFPFQKDPYDPHSRLPRAEVHDYVLSELVPAMVKAVQLQVNQWEFPWRQAKSRYRSGEPDHRLSVALTQSGTWFHGRAPSTAHSGISINVESKNFAAYQTLTDGIMAYFHHELFHNLQRDLNLDAGWTGDVDGEHEEWAFITEGTAVMVASVAQPHAEFGLSAEKRAYMSKANQYLAGDQFYSHELNTSYTQIDPYRASIYWRFLYDQYSRAYGAAEDQAIGMQVIRQTLNALYRSTSPDGDSPANSVKDLPAIIDQALANVPGGPFMNFEDSLVHFARAIYALRLQGGRWDGSGRPVGSIFYDPKEDYAEPPVEVVEYSGERLEYADAIASSFGIDFIDVVIGANAQDKPLVIEFSTARQSAVRFNLQVWKLLDPRNGKRPRPVVDQAAGPEVVKELNAQGNLLYTIPRIDTEEYNRLGLMITRIDANEEFDSIGAYTITLH